VATSHEHRAIGATVKYLIDRKEDAKEDSAEYNAAVEAIGKLIEVHPGALV
jgi:hypothetical protein